MNNTECLKELRNGLNEYLDSTFYVPGFADAIRHAISELERTDAYKNIELICWNSVHYDNRRS